MNLKKQRISYIMMITLATITLLYISDQILAISYNTKIVVKFVLFTMGPILYIHKTGYNFFSESFGHIKQIKNIKLSAILGIIVFLSIVIAYYFVKQWIDLNTLVKEFEDKYKINQKNILYYGLYITFINSWLEEAFFRGFIFLNLKKLGFKRFAYFISALSFSVYHIANFQNWFSWQVFFLACLGLFVGGIIFNYLDDKPDTFFNSWWVHICADLAIIMIGFEIFNII